MSPTCLSVADLVRRAALSQDPTLLAEVKAHAAEILAVLDVSDIEFSAEEIKSLEHSPQGLAAVLATLRGTERANPDDARMSAHIEELRDREARDIARAVTALEAGLPGPAQSLAAFADAPDVPVEVARALNRQWRKLGTGSRVLELTAKGITPATLFDAIHGLEMLLARHVRPAGMAPSSPWVLPLRSARQADTRATAIRLPLARVLAELRSSPECPPGAQSAILRHIGVLGAHYPALFAGFRVLRVCAEALVLEHDPASRQVSYGERWRGCRDR